VVSLGHLEENELNIDAAIRETEEEAGIKARDLNIHHDFEKVLTVIKLI
jgi:8-oxo-dGTP pyrophosphatase MutT (NUDIX family)